MGKLKISLLIAIFFMPEVHSQISVPKNYSVNVEIADSFFQNKKYCNAGKYYNKAFDGGAGYSTDYHRLQAALAWVHCGKKDSSLVHLYVLIYSIGYSDFTEINKLFKNTILYADPEFKKLLVHCKCLQKNKLKIYKPQPARILDSIYIVDQSSRSLLNSNQIKIAENKNESSEVSNLRQIDSLYKIYGWLSVSEVGYNASQVQFLAIQHSDLLNQKKWFPVVKKAVQDCLLAPTNYALLIDRILVFSGKKQIYGTQFLFDTKTSSYVPYPIKESRYVNKRRIKLGMTTLEVEISIYN
jgi:hypothetical protein